MPPGGVGDLDVRGHGQGVVEQARQATFHDLGVVEIELQVEVWLFRRPENCQRITRPVEEIAGNVDLAVDRLDQRLDAVPTHCRAANRMLST